MRKTWQIGAVLVGGLLLIGGGFAFTAYEATQQVPTFYREAIKQDVVVQQKASDECLQQVAALASEVRQPGRWQALFSAEQINGWLAVDLVKNYPEMLTAEVQEPRAAIAPNQATLACRYQDGDLSTVMSLTFDVFLSEPNVVGVRICKARAGLLPVPLTQVLEGISEVARNLELPLQWRQADGDPVALITIPPPRDDDDQILHLETIELRDGEVFLAGHTDRPGVKTAEEKKASDGGVPTAQVGQEPESSTKPHWARLDVKQNTQR